MRKSIVLSVTFVFLLFSAAISSAQEVGTIGDSAESVRSHKGDKGISFSVSGLSSVGIGLVEGGGGLKYWISKRVAIIGSIGIGAYSSTMTYPYPDYTDSKTTSNKFSVFAGVEDHFFIKKKISPYWGGGIRFITYSSTRHYSIPVVSPPSTSTEKEKTSTNSFGIRSFCGIEYFFADWVSLAGQYQIDYYYEKATTKRTLVGGPGVTQPRDRKRTRTTLDLNSSSLVATFYIW
jgi:hypothetical protein